MSRSETDRCREAERFRKIDAAFRQGDLEALREAAKIPILFPMVQCLWLSERAWSTRSITARINDFTALHMAAAVNYPEAVRLLLEAGANPNLRTRIDDYETPREFAEKAQRRDIAALLASAERSFIQR